jgi:4-amino-4-deoxy-L-arabinose transferase-like glycosyltransferase
LTPINGIPVKQFLPKNRNVAFIICILLLGVGLRLYGLNSQSFWTDEIFTYNGASETLAKIAFEPEVNLSIQPFYYSIAHFFIGPYKNQEALLRGPSVILGSISILLIFLITKNLIGNKGGILSALILAISPFHIWYSQEARPYAMLICLALLSFWLFQKLLKDGTNFWWRVSFVISTTLIFYCHTVGIVFIGFLVVYILLVVPRTNWNVWRPVFLSILVLVLPAFYRTAIVPPIVRGAQTWRPFNSLSIPYVLWAFSIGYTLGPSITELHMPDRMNSVVGYMHIILPIMIVFFTVFLIGAYNLFRQDKSKFLCASLWLLFPLSFAVGGAIFSANEFNVRYTILSFPPFLIFLTNGMLNIKFKWIRICTLGLVLLISVLSLSNHYFNHKYYKEDNRGAGQFLLSYAAPHDLVLCVTGYTERDLQHYTNDAKIIIDRLVAKTLYIEPDTIPRTVSKKISGKEQFWLFLSRTYHSDPESNIRKYCEDHFFRKKKYRSDGVELLLYSKFSS